MRGLTDTSSRLLVKQFIEFLEYSGMSGFSGFRCEHFDYFVLHDDEDSRRWVLEQVKDFATQVQASLHRFAPFYDGYELVLSNGPIHTVGLLSALATRIVT